MTNDAALTLQLYDIRAPSYRWRGRGVHGWQNAGVPVRLLILEDDDAIRASLALAMEAEGYEALLQPAQSHLPSASCDLGHRPWPAVGLPGEGRRAHGG